MRLKWTLWILVTFKIEENKIDVEEKKKDLKVASSQIVFNFSGFLKKYDKSLSSTL